MQRARKLFANGSSNGSPCTIHQRGAGESYFENFEAEKNLLIVRSHLDVQLVGFLKALTLPLPIRCEILSRQNVLGLESPTWMDRLWLLFIVGKGRREKLLTIQQMQ